MEKKLYRSRNDKKVCGVCAGLAKYLNMDVSVARLLGAILVLFTGIGLVAYIVAAIIVPEEPEFQETYYNEEEYDKDSREF